MLEAVSIVLDLAAPTSSIACSGDISVCLCWRGPDANDPNTTSARTKRLCIREQATSIAGVATKSTSVTKKTILSQSLQHLWQEKTGVLSTQVCSRMLHSTMVDYDSVKTPDTIELCGRLYDEHAVQRSAGISCKISTACHVGRCLLKAGHILYWSCGGQTCYGKVEFFASQGAGQDVLVYEELRPRETVTPFSLHLAPTGCKTSILPRDLSTIRQPAWWTRDNGSWLCLL